MDTCPICKKAVQPRAENPVFPFCSQRCKMVDLGAWLNEAYRMPVEDEDAAIDDEPHPDSKGNVRH
ncbi:MAG TPA: DNA gyrase inhibitor YacG [Labilithrix sp.]